MAHHADECREIRNRSPELPVRETGHTSSCFQQDQEWNWLWIAVPAGAARKVFIRVWMAPPLPQEVGHGQGDEHEMIARDTQSVSFTAS